MRILYLNPSGQLGGAEKSLIDLMAGLTQAEPSWRLGLIVNTDGPLLATVRALGVQTMIVPMPEGLVRLGDSPVDSPGRRHPIGLIARVFVEIPHAVAYLRRLAEAVREFAPDIVHSNGLKMHLFAAWALASRYPVIWHVRDYVGRRPLMRRLMRLSANRCDLAIANSDSVAEDLREVCAARLKVVRIYNGVDLDRFNPTGPVLALDDVAAVSSAAKATLRVGLIATMAPWKGHRLFLRALAEVARDIEVRGYVIGGPIYETETSQQSIEELHKLAAELGIAQCVGFTGFVANSDQAIRALDIVVHASTAPEPFGRVIVEAMACGKPVIASRAGGARELIHEEIDALSFTPGDHRDLARQITRLAHDGELRALLARNALANARARFGRGRLAAEILSVYRSVVRRGRSRRAPRRIR